MAKKSRRPPRMQTGGQPPAAGQLGYPDPNAAYFPLGAVALPDGRIGSPGPDGRLYPIMWNPNGGGWMYVPGEEPPGAAPAPVRIPPDGTRSLAPPPPDGAQPVPVPQPPTAGVSAPPAPRGLAGGVMAARQAGAGPADGSGSPSAAPAPVVPAPRGLAAGVQAGLRAGAGPPAVPAPILGAIGGPNAQPLPIPAATTMPDPNAPPPVLGAIGGPNAQPLPLPAVTTMPDASVPPPFDLNDYMSRFAPPSAIRADGSIDQNALAAARAPFQDDRANSHYAALGQPPQRFAGGGQADLPVPSLDGPTVDIVAGEGKIRPGNNRAEIIIPPEAFHLITYAEGPIKTAVPERSLVVPMQAQLEDETRALFKPAGGTPLQETGRDLTDPAGNRYARGGTVTSYGPGGATTGSPTPELSPEESQSQHQNILNYYTNSSQYPIGPNGMPTRSPEIGDAIGWDVYNYQIQQAQANALRQAEAARQHQQEEQEAQVRAQQQYAAMVELNRAYANRGSFFQSPAGPPEPIGYAPSLPPGSPNPYVGVGTFASPQNLQMLYALDPKQLERYDQQLKFLGRVGGVDALAAQLQRVGPGVTRTAAYQ